MGFTYLDLTNRWLKTIFSVVGNLQMWRADYMHYTILYNTGASADFGIAGCPETSPLMDNKAQL